MLNPDRQNKKLDPDRQKRKVEPGPIKQKVGPGPTKQKVGPKSTKINWTRTRTGRVWKDPQLPISQSVCYKSRVEATGDKLKT